MPLLVKVSGTGQAFTAGLNKTKALAGVKVETLLTLPGPAAAGPGIAGATAATWLRVDPGGGGGNPWDQAHAALDGGSSFALAGLPGLEAIEPDLAQHWGEPPPATPPALAAAEQPNFKPQTAEGGREIGGKDADSVGWHLDDAYSQLRQAREKVGDRQKQILIAHLDTGYDPHHVTLPRGLETDLARNFVGDGFPPNDATDHAPEHGLLTTRGHGTATLALLAGKALDGTTPGWKGWTEDLGGAPLARILPIRIADGVVRFTTGTMVQGFGHACAQGAHVLSMSMGGLASHALADAVNLAYERGLVLVTAAGNNFAGVPTPKSIVFPARFRRVLAACGVMAQGSAYANLAPLTMQGNFGPDSKMATALGAYTPNLPWARIDSGRLVDMDGAGTSSATPQIAAAAALWLAAHWKEVSAYPEPWMRVEAVRHALFSAATKATARMNPAETARTLGQGVLRAADALAVAALGEAEVKPLWLPPAKATFGWLEGLFGGGVSLAATGQTRPAMLALELTQMAQRLAELDLAIDDPDLPAEQISPAARRRYLEAAFDLGQPSRPLAAWLRERLGRTVPAGPGGGGPPPPAPPTAGGPAPSPPARPAPTPPVPDRRLRVYALDPSLGKSLDALAVNQTVLRVPWDDHPLTGAPLRPGPVGEYLEVIDVDPASNRVYPPVDLNQPLLLAQDGWAPSEGNPQFHQQMVYAVAMTTIRHFEQALGRRALWAPRQVTRTNPANGQLDTTAEPVERLRLYPHAFRDRNAYYSPERKAVLFGYFPADSRQGDLTPPGTMVFSCLSGDIIAHEMSHALLDGLNRRFQEASNPDLPAFHEAFADIVALFQHFTLTDLVRFEIGRAGGDLTALSLLGGLARQFGEGSGRRGPLRDYATPAGAALTYQDTLEPHDRGSILVFAVYEAFLAIVERRSADLLRLAKAGGGAALPADLVERLTGETTKAAGHVLRICIRALDYLPPVDVTFGDYLRALITADRDLVPEDSWGYRTAFLQAFRRRGILPLDLRTIAEDSLAWNGSDDPRPAWLAGVLGQLTLDWDLDTDRTTLFARNQSNRLALRLALAAHFAGAPAACQAFGLRPGVARYDAAGRQTAPARAALGGTTFDVSGVRPARRVAPNGGFRTDIVVQITQRYPVPLDGRDIANGFVWFRGGATLILDSRPGMAEIRYAIVKNIDSATRLDRRLRYARGEPDGSLRRLYFGAGTGEPFAILHAREEEFDHVR
ncbi:S8 family serine peptidase [Phaeospirillum tilakii]|uniref:S8 family serine peptidase n=1 Tax=Phaeospirillum tilakii TaxID=741673 RepID=A0ABW5C7P7_9PROT